MESPITTLSSGFKRLRKFPMIFTPSHFPDGYHSDHQNVCRSMGANCGVNVTVMDSDGTVLNDG